MVNNESDPEKTNSPTVPQESDRTHTAAQIIQSLESEGLLTELLGDGQSDGLEVVFSDKAVICTLVPMGKRG